MKRTFFALLLCLVFALSACGVPQEDYDDLVEANASLITQVKSLETRNQNLEKLVEELKTEIANSSSEVSETEETATTDTSNALEEYKKQQEATANEPDDIEIVSYAQTVIKDFYPDSKFPFGATKEYKVVKTNLKYKIEGTFKENKNASYEDFCMIIEFLDDKYETYDLISLQVGKIDIYKSLTANSVNANPTKDTILNDQNTQIYNEVMNTLNSDYDRDEDEIFEEMAPQYGMTADELKQFMLDYMEAYYQ